MDWMEVRGHGALTRIVDVRSEEVWTSIMESDALNER